VWYILIISKILLNKNKFIGSSIFFLIYCSWIQINTVIDNTGCLDNKYGIEIFKILVYTIDVGRDDQGKVKSEVVRCECKMGIVCKS